MPGDSDLEQLQKIFNLVGTPNDVNWPNAKLLPGYVEFEVRFCPCHIYMSRPYIYTILHTPYIMHHTLYTVHHTSYQYTPYTKVHTFAYTLSTLPTHAIAHIIQTREKLDLLPIVRSAQAVDLLNKMLCLNPLKRISAKQVSICA